MDTPEAMDGILNIAKEFNIALGALAGVWSRFPDNGCTERRARKQGEYGHNPMSGGPDSYVYIVSTISQSRYDELHTERQLFSSETFRCE